ncbi:MAG: beta-ketoacyl-ACP synthase II [bacterium]
MEQEDLQTNLWKLLNLFNQWEKVQDICEKTIGSGIQIIGVDGKNTLERQYTSPFCQVILDSKPGYQKCIFSYLEGCFWEGALREGWTIFKCHTGLTNFALPIIIYQKPVAAIVGGRILSDDIDEAKYINYLQELNINPQKAIDALKKIKKISQTEFNTFGRMIRMLIEPLKESVIEHYLLTEKAESITNLLKEKEKLIHVDELTGLHNRIYLNERLDEEISLATRKNRPLSVIIFNIDNFRRLNDLYGYAAGDSILKETAEILLSYTRKEDVLIRAEEDEFILILTETKEDNAKILAQRIQTEINNHHFCQKEGLNILLTISCGIATFGDKISNSKELIDKVKQALYTAKSRGGEKIIPFSIVEKEAIRIPRRCVITGIGVITPIGFGKKDFWTALCQGTPGISRITLFDASSVPVKIAAEIKDFDPAKYMDKKSLKRTDRETQFAVGAAKLALEDAQIDLTKEDKERIDVIIGAGVGGLAFAEEQIISFIQEGPEKISPFLSIIAFSGALSSMVSLELGLKGASLTIASGCPAGTDAIGYGFNAIRNGEVDVVVAGGAEAPIRPVVITSFYAMNALSLRNDEPQKASRPFDANRDGFVIGEGAGVVILEEIEHAKTRGAHIYAEIVSFATTNDAYHMCAPAPDGKEAARAFKLALQSANISPQEVNYINPHGSSTPLGDRTETLVIKQAFGDYAYHIPISSTKSMLGHSIGATGAVELIVCALAIDKSFIPPTINYETPDPTCDLDYVPNKGREKVVNVAFSNSFGFGGKNSAIVIKKVT